MRILKNFTNWLNPQYMAPRWLALGLGFGGLISVAPLSGSDFSNHTQHQLSPSLQSWIKNRLPNSLKVSSEKIAKTIESSSLKYGLDPVMLVSLIEIESRFRPAQVGAAGEIGLMQIKPSTAAWVIKKYRMPKSFNTRLKDPVVNIEVGTRYLSYLRDRFSFQASTYLTAYNQGISRVLSKAAESSRQRTPSSLESNYSRKIYGKYLEMVSLETPTWPGLVVANNLNATIISR
jgi:soluble lytic murein transglycosylase-like protein